jgi:hypothetical protein
VTANAHHILSCPASWFVIELLELKGHALRMLIEPADVGIYAAHEMFCNLLRILTIGGPFLSHIAAVEKQASGLVLFNETRAKYLRQLAQASPAPEIDLKEAVPCGIETLCKEQVGFVLCVDVRHSPPVDQNLNWLLEFLQ